jgi:hypothetical protein
MGGIGINLSQKDFITTIHNNSAWSTTTASID